MKHNNTDGVPASPAGVPVFRMELTAGDRYELRQLDDFGSLPEGEYVLHAVPADGVPGTFNAQEKNHG